MFICIYIYTHFVDELNVFMAVGKGKRCRCVARWARVGMCACVVDDDACVYICACFVDGGLRVCACVCFMDISR